MKQFALTICFFIAACSKSYSQKIYPFTIKIDTSHFSFDDLVPAITIINPLTDRIFEDIEFPSKKGVYPFQGSVNLSKPVFFKIVNVPILGIPNHTLSGLLDNEGCKLVLYDSSDINNFLISINDTIEQFTRKKFSKKFDNKEWLVLHDSFRYFINGRIAFLNSDTAAKQYKLSNQTRIACIEYCKAMIAWQIISPLFVNHIKKQSNIESIIQEDVKIINPDYWIQLGAGRGFLRTYFFEILLTKYNYDMNKVFNNETLYRHNQIRRYIGYQYFTSLLKNDSTFTDYMGTVKKIDEFKKKYDCNRDDIKMFDKIREQFLRKGNDVTDLFNKQDLVNYSGKEVKQEKWDMLKGQGKVFIYYWASWCVPCLETMSKLKNTTTTYEGKQYKILFISIDKKQEQWQRVKKNILAPANSFRLSNVSKKSFFTVFQVTSVPRVFLIDDGRLVETNYPKPKFEKVFGIDTHE